HYKNGDDSPFPSDPFSEGEGEGAFGFCLAYNAVSTVCSRLGILENVSDKESAPHRAGANSGLDWIIAASSLLAPELEPGRYANGLSVFPTLAGLHFGDRCPGVAADWEFTVGSFAAGFHAAIRRFGPGMVAF